MIKSLLSVKTGDFDFFTGCVLTFFNPAHFAGFKHNFNSVGM